MLDEDVERPVPVELSGSRSPIATRSSGFERPGTPRRPAGVSDQNAFTHRELVGRHMPHVAMFAGERLALAVDEHDRIDRVLGQVVAEADRLDSLCVSTPTPGSTVTLTISLLRSIAPNEALTARVLAPRPTCDPATRPQRRHHPNRVKSPPPKRHPAEPVPTAPSRPSTHLAR